MQKCNEVKYDVMCKQNKTKGVITKHEHLFVCITSYFTSLQFVSMPCACNGSGTTEYTSCCIATQVTHEHRQLLHVGVRSSSLNRCAVRGNQFVSLVPRPPHA